MVAVPSLYVMAEALVEVGVSVRTRTFARVVVACIALSALGLDPAGEISFTYYGIVLAPIVASVRNALIVAFMAIPVLMLLAGYRRAPHGNRLRIRWVLWSTAFLLVCVSRRSGGSAGPESPSVPVPAHQHGAVVRVCGIPLRRDSDPPGGRFIRRQSRSRVRGDHRPALRHLLSARAGIARACGRRQAELGAAGDRGAVAVALPPSRLAFQSCS